MKKILTTPLQVLTATIVLFFVLETLCFLAGFPRGAGKFIEKIVIREHLSLRKPKDEFRIFTYGESTMHGSHYGPVSNPSRWLALYLKDFLPGKKIRVVNFARMGHESGFTYRAFQDTVVYHPDLVVFYMGHNELLPDNLDSQIRCKEKKFSRKIDRLFRKSRFASVVYRLFLQWRVSTLTSKHDDSIEYRVIETNPSGFGPESVVLRNGPVYKENVENFKEKLLNILDLAEKQHVQILFFKPVGNLKDFSPYYSAHQKTLAPEEISRWGSLYQQGKKAEEAGNAELARDFYEKAFLIDDTYADLSFRLGKIYFKEGELEKAKKLFEQARDDDGVVVRASTDIYEVYEELRKTRHLQLIDTEKIFRPEAPGGILGKPIIEDNVHPSIKGQSLMARALAEEIAKRNWIAPMEKWRFERERPFDEMARELGITDELLFSAFLKMVHYFGSRFDNRIDYAQKALAIHPLDPRALRHLAWSYWLMGEKEKALEVYDKLHQIDPASLQSVFQNQPEIQAAWHAAMLQKQK